jgi:hypothetical protein
MTNQITLRKLLHEHHYNRKKKIKHEFSGLFIIGDNEQIEADLSGISIRDSTFSGVNFAKVTLTNAKLSNVHFEAARNLTLTICKGPKDSDPSPNGEAEESTVQPVEGPQQQVLFSGSETTTSTSATVSVELVAPDLLTVLQDIRNLKVKTIIELIRESLIRETADRVKNRPEQAQFRRDLLDGYNHQCAISGPARDDLLEAAHIIPYFLLEKVGAGQFGNSRWNGLALRPGLHRLFDENKLRITENGEIFVDSQVPGFYVNWEQVVLPPLADSPPACLPPALDETPECFAVKIAVDSIPFCGIASHVTWGASGGLTSNTPDLLKDRQVSRFKCLPCLRLSLLPTR